MKVKIFKRIVEEKVIDIEVPFYYRHDLSDDHPKNVIYGKITETKHKTIQLGSKFGRKDFAKFNVEEFDVNHGFLNLAEYLTNVKYESNETEWEQAKKEAVLMSLLI